MSEPPLKRARTDAPVPKESEDESVALETPVDAQQAYIKQLEDAIDELDRKILALSLSLHQFANVGAIRYIYNVCIYLVKETGLRSAASRTCFPKTYETRNIIGRAGLRRFLQSAGLKRQVTKLKRRLPEDARHHADRVHDLDFTPEDISTFTDNKQFGIWKDWAFTVRQRYTTEFWEIISQKTVKETPDKKVSFKISLKRKTERLITSTEWKR